MRAYHGPIGGITTRSLLQETRECIRSSEITIEYGTKKAKDWETSQNLGYFYETKQMEEGKRIKRKKEEGTGDGSQKKQGDLLSGSSCY